MILFYLPSLRAGGAENVMVQLLVFFHQNGTEVRLLLGKKEGELLSRIPASIPIDELGAFRARNAIWRLIRYCRANPPDYIFSCLGASVSAACARLFIQQDIRLVTRMGSTLGAEKKFIKMPIRQLSYLFANGAVAMASDTIICQSQYMKQDYHNELGAGFASKIKVIYNPVDTCRAFRLAAEEPAKKFDLVGIGRLVPQKEYPTMIKGVYELKRMGWTDIRLGIIGSGFMKDRLQQQVVELGLEDHVSFLGFQTNPFSYLKHAKILISSSLYEGFSNVIIESLALGVPVVASDCPSGNKEVVEPGRNGYLYKPGNAEDLVDKVDQVLRNPEQFDADRIAAEAKRKYDLTNIGKQFLSVFGF